MKIPKKIEKLLQQRVKYAHAVRKADYEVSHWLDQHEIATEQYDTYGGVEIFGNPEKSAERIREAIRKKVVCSPDS